MLEQISMLPIIPTVSDGAVCSESLCDTKSTPTGMYVYPNYVTDAWMGVEYPLEDGPQVSLLLRLALDEREYNLPVYPLSEADAAKKLGISRASLRRWVNKGWIHCWIEWEPVGDSKVMRPLPGRIFSETEVEALCIAKPRNF